MLNHRLTLGLTDAISSGPVLKVFFVVIILLFSTLNSTA
jgi:hypothetical protein